MYREERSELAVVNVVYGGIVELLRELNERERVGEMGMKMKLHCLTG